MERSSSWLEWSGWDFISAVAAVLSLAAIVIAVWEIVRRGRRYPSVVWRLEQVPSLAVPELAADNYVAEVTNDGSGTARLSFIRVANGVLVREAGERTRWSAQSGEHLDFVVQSQDPEKVWITLGYQHVDDLRYLFLIWFPLQSNSKVNELRQADSKRLPRTPWGKWRYWHEAAPIGPGGKIGAKIRADRSGWLERLARCKESPNGDPIEHVQRGS